MAWSQPWGSYWSLQVTQSCAAEPSEVLNTSEDVLPGPSGLAQGHGQMAADSNSEYSCVSADKLFCCEFKRKSQEDVAQPKSSAVVPPGGEAAEEKSTASQYFSCFSSRSQLICANEDEFKRKSQEDVAQPKSSAVVPPGDEAAEEKSTASQYFSCFSSRSQLIRANEDGKGNTQVGSEHGWEVQLSYSAQALYFKSPLKNLKRASGRGTRTEGSAEGQMAMCLQG
ncbi:uncharacterized protein LOC125101216 [Lutra lutra]|uniref:uncharacterized protein LOC125101216 n=1 Tax=Lutra lutra TaxID=9657 RepID=UPI001FD3F835|nr:uncharacterized protein LOC125101216 [Lutra lutra]